MPLPSTEARPWYVKDKWPAIVALPLGSFSSLFLLWSDWNTPNTPKILASCATLLSVVALGSLKFAQACYKDARDDKKESPEDLRGCLHVIYRAVAHKKGVSDPPDGWMRITIYRFYSEKGEDKLEQLVNYIGGDEENADRAAGRCFSTKYGLIGAVARGGEPSSFDRRADMSWSEWVKYLVDEMSMSQLEAQRTRPDRYAFFGFPITGSNEDVRAVVYMDAGKPAFFDVDTVNLVSAACLGLAKWIDERYYRGG